MAEEFICFTMDVSNVILICKERTNQKIKKIGHITVLDDSLGKQIIKQKEH